jgi:hypothetical protein
LIIGLLTPDYREAQGLLTGKKGKLSCLFSLSLLSPHSRGALMGGHVRILACTDKRLDAKVF